MSPWQRRLAPLPARQLPGGLVVHEAGTLRARRRGLAGIAALPPGRALHLRPCRAVHTFGMRFAVDLVWLGRDGRVVRIDREVPPRRHRVCRRAHSVLELAAGAADAVLDSTCEPGSAPAILGDVDRAFRPHARFLTRSRHS